MSLILPPAINPLTISVVFNVNDAPYAIVWYQDNKIFGETPSDFIIRMLKPIAKKYIQNKELFLQNNIIVSDVSSIL